MARQIPRFSSPSPSHAMMPRRVAHLFAVGFPILRPVAPMVSPNPASPSAPDWVSCSKEAAFFLKPLPDHSVRTPPHPGSVRGTHGPISTVMLMPVEQLGDTASCKDDATTAVA